MGDKVVAIRADASSSIGSGHIRRMSILAQHLERRSIIPVLLCSEDTLKFLSSLDYVFSAVHVIEDENDGPQLLMDHYGESLKAIFFDHYRLDSKVHIKYRNVALILIAIDDMADRYLDVDVLFDVNLGRNPESYIDLLPNECERFVGAQYQIIKSDFYKYRFQTLTQRLNAQGRIQRIFVSMGGTDALSLTSKIVINVTKIFPTCYVDIVTGSVSPNLDALKQMVKLFGIRVTLHVDIPNVAELMSKADLAIGAGGTMTWERNCLGLPSILLIVADNQQQVGFQMQKARAAIVIDAQVVYPESQVVAALYKLKNNPTEVLELGKNAMALSSENGANKIVDIIAQKID